ncbi:MAG TPA: hypothetical protein VFZ78_00690 [Flavisolibacter sp.]
MVHYLSLATIVTLAWVPATAQSSTNKGMLQVVSKQRLVYVDLDQGDGIVYLMGFVMDKGGSGYSMGTSDTLHRQTDGLLKGKITWVRGAGDEQFLFLSSKKSTRQFRVAPVQDLEQAYENLNNAYYLDAYFRMKDSINKAYPLQHHSFRNAFSSWRSVTHKNMHYLQFREYADRRLQEINDSIRRRQDHFVALTDYLRRNIKTMEYPTLKDSLLVLPVDYPYMSKYFSTVVGEMARQQPEYFFRLAQELPQHQHLIFFSVEKEKATLAGLQAVEGYPEVKKAFFKTRKS